MISYVLPTRNRPERLRRTLLAIEALGPHAGGGEIVIVDNASDEFPILPRTLENNLRVRVVRRATNEGAAARNAGVMACDPESAWIVMLDDDSFPLNLDFLEAIAGASSDVAAISADIFLRPPPGGRVGAENDSRGESREDVLRLWPLHEVERDLIFPNSSARGGVHAPHAPHPSPRGAAAPGLPVRESGGLPEVFVGCGVAIRREAFLNSRGYDGAFGYYAEEYDLSAKLLLAGHRIAFEPSFQVLHGKDPSHRDFQQIVERLVRNNSWIAQRYAPEHERVAMLRETRRRYRQIAEAEEALAGFSRGLLETRRTLRGQRRTPMSQELFDRFTGLAAAREALQSAFDASPFRSAHLCDVGKNAHVVARALAELGVRVTSDDEESEVQVIATMSPGPMLDALAKRRATWRPHSPRTVAPWLTPAGSMRLDTMLLPASERASRSISRIAVRRAG